MLGRRIHVICGVMKKMPYRADIIADSVNQSGDRLTTFVCSYPRFIHAQVLTHRAFSRNSASSRAIPTKKLIDMVRQDPAAPIRFGKNQPGMVAGDLCDGETAIKALEVWYKAKDMALDAAEVMAELGVAKETVNRILEPYQYITTIITATEFQNFFKLRCADDAQPEIQKLACMMQDALAASSPQLVEPNGLHLPLIQSDEHVLSANSLEWNEPLGFSCNLLDNDTAKKVSVARCARVSYLTHEGKRDLSKDIELHDRLLKDGHMSPFEHVAFALSVSTPVGNFRGWVQYRKQVEWAEGWCENA